jgi:hypothetical protein
VSASETEFTPGKKAWAVRALTTSRAAGDTLAPINRRNYNAWKFTSPASAGRWLGNYLLDGMANQALWRLEPKRERLRCEVCIRLESTERPPQQKDAHGGTAF